MRRVPLDIDLIRVALSSTDINFPSLEIRFNSQYVSAANAEIVRLRRAFGANPEALRMAQTSVVVRLIEMCNVSVEPREAVPTVALAICREWLTRNLSWRPSGQDAALDLLRSETSHPLPRDHLENRLRAAELMVADPLLVFVAAPVTSSLAEETEAIIALSKELRQELSRLRVRVHVAPKAADSRIHPDFSDDPEWRDHDERWIRRSDLVVILHTRPATGLGNVYEIARGAGVPVLVVSGPALTPMVSRGLTPEALLGWSDFQTKVAEYVLRHGQELLQHRSRSREASRTIWRPARLQLRAHVACLSDQGACQARPIAITRARLTAILHDDYAFASLTMHEWLDVESMLRADTIAPLSEKAMRAFALAALEWDDDRATEVLIAGRELLALGAGDAARFHRTSPTDTSFWRAVYDGVDWES